VVIQEQEMVRLLGRQQLASAMLEMEMARLLGSYQQMAIQRQEMARLFGRKYTTGHLGAGGDKVAG
jgi:hypothetical protein